jgi:predicted site-specific integrase-resolvase
VKLSTYAKREGIGYRAAWERFRNGRIPGATMDSSGHIHVPEPESMLLPMAAVYARVSSHPQKNDLDRQAERLIAYAGARGYQVVAVVKEVASGVNDKRPRLAKLLSNPGWGTLVVEHKDRLSRVGFGRFEVLLGAQGKKIDVANPAQDDTSDLMADFMAIVYSFAARMYGLRSAKHRSNRVKAAMTAPVDIAAEKVGASQ